MRETIKMARRIQPDVMLRARGIGNYGDYYTPEGFVPGNKENTHMPWMVIYPLASSFSYDPDPAKYKGGKWIIHNLVDAVSKGGNFMVGIGPDGNGRWHPMAVKNLEEAGAWLHVNGEAIYATRPRPGDLWKEGNQIRFSSTKDGRILYAIGLVWPGERLVLKSVKAKKGSPVHLLGIKQPLHSHQEREGLVIDIPEFLQNESNRPNGIAYVFKIEPEQ
jgi:alpha-L-fucosidase